MLEFELAPDKGDYGKEYFCNSCGQLRFYAQFGKIVSCGHCDGRNLIIGEAGTLDKEELKRKFSEEVTKP